MGNSLDSQQNNAGSQNVYIGADGKPQINVRVEDETVWLMQGQLAELFSTSHPNVTMPIKNIFTENELKGISVCKSFLHTATDGKTYNTKHYSLDMIISLGCRTQSQVATRFRIWATERLREYIIKGFTIDGERLKEENGNYWKELLDKRYAWRSLGC